MPYSPLCETPLSNFEANSNYQERTDTSVYAKFNIEDSDEKLLIWTTTPWSLFANQGICVNPELTYTLIHLDTKDGSELVWMCQDLIEKFCVGEFSSYQIVRTCLGEDLVGLKYRPIFKIPGYSNYQVYGDTYVQSTTGTGLVHLAPLFGEDDMRVMKLNGYQDSQLPEYLVDSQVRFNIDYHLNNTNIKGRFVMDTSTDIVIYLKQSHQALKSEKIKHSYPHCWRTDGPLVYLTTDAWFMNVQKIIPELVENNKKIHWYPEYVGTERFANWIKDSPDWCLSRNRVWGTPIPVWVGSDGSMICIGSVNELSKYTGQTYTDLHLDKIGDISFEINGITYTRTFGVLDCWFESGMAGLARFGYPDCASKSYPVDFIAESIDQTRGWFYTLNVLSTALNHQPAFKKVIVSGLILAADGKKMSKRLGNYTSPNSLIQKYGADIFRLYLIGSPSAKAESFCFKDSDLTELTRKMIPYYNAHMLLSECVIWAKETFGTVEWIQTTSSDNKLDLWIKNKFIELAQTVYSHMEKLELTHVPNLIFKFIDTLCNLFIKLSRERMKGLNGDSECKNSLSTLWSVMNDFNQLLAPFIPHLSEKFSMLLFNISSETNKEPYQSIHLRQINLDKIMNQTIDSKLLNGFYSVNEFMESVRNLRQQINKPLYYPLQKMVLYTDSGDISEFGDVVCKELNVKQLEINNTETIPRTYKANKGAIGKVFKKELVKYSQMIEQGNIGWSGCHPSFYIEDYDLSQLSKPNMIGTKFSFVDSNGLIKQAVVYLDSQTNQLTDMEAEINNIRRQVNGIRKDMGLKLFNRVKVIFEKCDYWTQLSDDMLGMLTTRLVADIMFTESLASYKVIETFNGKEIKVNIELI